MHLAEISPDLKSFARKCSISRFSGGFFGFWGENPPTDQSFSGFGGGDSPPT